MFARQFKVPPQMLASHLRGQSSSNPTTPADQQHFATCFKSLRSSFMLFASHLSNNVGCWCWCIRGRQTIVNGWYICLQRQSSDKSTLIWKIKGVAWHSRFVWKHSWQVSLYLFYFFLHDYYFARISTQPLESNICVKLTLPLFKRKEITKERCKVTAERHKITTAKRRKLLKRQNAFKEHKPSLRQLSQISLINKVSAVLGSRCSSGSPQELRESFWVALLNRLRKRTQNWHKYHF